MSSKNHHAKRKSMPTLVLYGLDEAGKPHAASFDAEQADTAVRLAEKKNFLVLKLVNEEQVAIAAQLESGRPFLSGQGSVPIVRQELFDRLVAAAASANKVAEGDGSSVTESAEMNQPPTAIGDGNIEPEASQSKPAKGPEKAGGATGAGGVSRADAMPVARGLPRSWEGIEVGHMVLAQESAEEGWWEAIVLEREDDLFTVRWRDYPKVPKFVRHRSALALICPPTV